MPSTRISSDIEAAIGVQVKRARLARGFTQTGLGQILQITYQQVQKYEKGSNRLAASTLLRISQVLDTPLLWFFSQDEDVPDRTSLSAGDDSEPAAR